MIKPFTFIDLFAGIGGFHLGMNHVGAKCVFVSEKDTYARLTYQKNFEIGEPELFNGNFAGDITKVNPQDIPDFDILCGGFPCQPFSNAGKQHGFNDVRGTLFFNIVEIIKTKQPKAFFLENVRNLVKHLKDRGIGVLITDHNVRETLDIIDRAYIMHEGTVLMEGTPSEIVNNVDVRRVYLGDRFSL